MAFTMAIINVKGYTLDNKKPQVEAVGLEEQFIKKTGTVDEIKEGISTSTLVIDGQGKTLLPGFSDAHTHFSNMAVRMSYFFELGQVKNREDLLDLVKKEARKKEKGEWVTGIAWDESKWEGDKTFIHREELDKVAPFHPVALFRVDGHICCVNSKTLEILDYPPGTRGVELCDGEPTGRLVEDAGFKIRQYIEPGAKEIATALVKAIEKAHSLGVTALHDIWVDQSKVKAYQYLRRNENLKLRVGFFFGDEYLDDLIRLGLFSLGDDYLSFKGLKLFVDGSIGASTAMVSKGYRTDPENKGYPMWEREELKEVIRKAHRNDISMAIHAIGDEAVHETLDLLEEVLDNNYLGHRLEHIELLTKDQIKRMKRLGVIGSMQPNFTGEWGHPGSMYEDRFGPDIIKTMNPLRWILDEGVCLFLGSDGMPFNPLYGIHSSVNPPFPCQKITPLEAIRGYTRLGAGKYPGMITPLGLGDMVLLEGDPFKEPQSIKDMKVSMTIFDGKVVYEAK